MISLADLKAHLGSAEVKVDADRDTVLPALEAAAVDFIQRETDWHFGAPTSFTEYRAGTDTRELWLLRSPSAITSVYEHTDVGDTWEEIVEANSDGFELRDDGLILRKGGYTWERKQEYRFIYDFGYTAGSEPLEIQQLVKDLVAHRWRQRGLEGHASGAQGDTSFTAADLDQIPGAVEVLERWRSKEIVAG